MTLLMDLLYNHGYYPLTNWDVLETSPVKYDEKNPRRSATSPVASRVLYGVYASTYWGEKNPVTHIYKVIYRGPISYNPSNPPLPKTRLSGALGALYFMTAPGLNSRFFCFFWGVHFQPTWKPPQN